MPPQRQRERQREERLGRMYCSWSDSEGEGPIQRPNTRSKRQRGRRTRGPEAQARRNEEYLKRSRLKIAEHTEIITYPVPFPDHFANAKANAANVTNMVEELWPTSPANLPNATDDDSMNLFIKSQEPAEEQRAAMGSGGTKRSLSARLPAAEIAALEADGEPEYLAIRWADAIPAETLKMLVRLWDTLRLLGVKFPEAEHQRSGMPALHLGVWEMYGKLIKITTDARQTKLTKHDLPKSAPKEEILAAIDDLCRAVKEHVVPRLKQLMDRDVPGHRRVQERIHARVLHQLRSNKDFALRPDQDFGGLFTTMAVKEGGSERIHIDWNDNLHKYALIFAAGDWEGGEFCIPQLGIRIPLRPGQVLAVRTRLLAHCTAPITSGRRLVFTCFTNSLLLEHTLAGKDYTVL
ncbi:hypothetical protein C8F04DRAFT_1281994 [Mycena alexandri]|uniref:Uncharacterized protein n=2 Tax=Mycena alexandri TaxID=1745969 RepID=A0AAD6WL51_9AGAR|nr:hypothetical protein C8F04DRAFT_1281994 [Mycena alexandri]